MGLVKSKSGWWGLAKDEFLSAEVIRQDRIDVLWQEVLRVWDLIPSGSTVIDVGANIGSWSVALMRRIGNGNLISIEPDPETFLALRGNISNELRNWNRQCNVDLRNVAIDDPARCSSFVRNHSNRGASATNAGRPDLIKGFSGDGVECIDVRIESLSEVGLRYKKVDFIKIDIEGAEIDAILSGKELIERDHPVLYVETNNGGLSWRNQSVEQLLDLIRSFGYSIQLFPDEQAPHDALCVPL